MSGWVGECWGMRQHLWSLAAFDQSCFTMMHPCACVSAGRDFDLRQGEKASGLQVQVIKMAVVPPV